MSAPSHRRRTLASALVAVVATTLSGLAVSQDWSGHYDAVRTASGTMEIEAAAAGKEPSLYRIVWRGGEDDSLGAATAATCVAVAKATTSPGGLTAELVPFALGEDSLDAATLAALSPEPLRVAPIGGAGVVRVEGLFPHCGLQVRLAGIYWRGESPASAPCQDCDAAALARQDGRLNRAYRDILGEMSRSEQERLRQLEREWLKSRDARCSKAKPEDGRCLARETSLRADALEALHRALKSIGRAPPQ